MRSALMIAVAAVVLASTGMPAWSQDKLEPIKSVSIGENREFRVNGKAFLPIMSWAQAPKNFRMLRGVGINTFCGNQGNVTAKAQCDAAKAAGGYGVCSFGEDGQGAIGDRYLLAWIHSDEPDMPRKAEGGGNAPRRPPAEVVANYKKIRQADPSRPVCVTFTANFMKQNAGSKYDAAAQQRIYSQFISGCDVAGFDTYPIYGSGLASHLNWPAYGTQQLCALAGARRPVYAWIETSKGSKWMTYSKQPDVLPMHTRFEVWGVLIEGATAIGYFTHAWRPSFREFAPNQAMQAELKRLNAQVTRLGPAILAPKATAKVTMSLAGDLKCHLKATQHEGALWIFAQNQDLGPGGEQKKQFQPVSPRAGKATLTVPGLKAGAKVEVVDENRTITAGDGRFTDEFAPLREHVYKVSR